MLTVISGSYRPDLESALLRRLRDLKKHPLDPVLIVTASSRLKDHLERLIAGKMGAVLNVHFHTLGSLAQTILHELRALEKPVLSDPLFFDHLVKSLIRRNKPFESFSDLAVPDGFPSAVRSTLRDLLDAGVDEELIRAAMEDKFVGKDVDVGSLKELLSLYRVYLEKLDELPVVPNAKILETAAEQAPRSRFLAECRTALFYGFYDLTGRQVEFFESVVRAFPSVLFFPYRPDDPDFEFAKRFRDNTLHRIGFSEEASPLSAEKTNGHKKNTSVFNVSGRHDEAWLVAREIRRLLDKGMDPSEIGVVARNKERLTSFPLRFDEWKIPYVSSASNSLLDDPKTLAALAGLKPLRADSPASWSEFVAKALALAPIEDENLLKALDTFKRFDLLDEKVSGDDFLEALKSRLAETPLPKDRPGRSVSVLHAEAARGLSFKVLFLIGLEERVFPRIVREDPFLRDDARFALRDTIGYKIGLKLTALEEERLLFRLLTDAAPTVVFVYQRSDDDGRVVGASPFLRDYFHRLDQELSSITVPRSPSEKLRAEKLEDVSPSDAVLKLLEGGKDKSAVEFLTALGGDGPSFAKGLQFQSSLQKFNDPGAQDGLIGPLTWAEIFRRGHGKASASAFETFGKCPWQFFGTKMLNLEEPESMDPTRLPPRDRGTVVHGFLEDLFRSISDGGKKELPAEVDKDLFNKLFDGRIPESLGAAYGIPAGLWAILRLDLRETLRLYVAEELGRLGESGRRPLYFEFEWNGTLDSPLNGGEWVGKIDRIDQGPDGVCVVDYKTGKPPKNRVALEAVRGRRAQPPIYLLIAEKAMKTGPFMFSYHPVNRDADIKDFPTADWEKYRGDIINTLLAQIKLMQKGVFPILPDSESNESYCDYCDLNRICRKHHSVSAYRALQGPGAEPWLIRQQKLPSKKDEDE